MNRKDRRAKGSKSSASAREEAALQNARSLMAQGKTQDGEFILRSVVETNPSCFTALYNLGLLCGQREDMTEALEFFKRAAAVDPKNADAVTYCALLSMETGDRTTALKLAEQAKSLSPSPRMLTRLGTLYRHAGDMDKARDHLHRAIAMQTDFTPAWRELHSIKTFTADDADFTMLKKINIDALPPAGQADILFALGKATLDTGDADAAFGFFARGNAVKKSMAKNYDVARFEEYAADIIRIFNADVVARQRGKGSNKDNSPIFIVGMPRSGSTLVDQILSSHPGVASAGEALFMQQVLPVYPNEKVKGLIRANLPSITEKFVSDLSPALLDDIAKKYLAKLHTAAKTPRIVDKMLFNYLWVGVIRLALPEAKIIHCTRHPADIGLSLWQLHFSEGMQWCYDQKDIARYYHAYKKVMDHWNKLFPGEIFEANYETIVANQESETRRLLEFCGLPWNDSCLTFHKTERQVKTASAAQVRQPVYASSSGKWKKYERHLTPLLSALEEKA